MVVAAARVAPRGRTTAIASGAPALRDTHRETGAYPSNVDVESELGRRGHYRDLPAALDGSTARERQLLRQVAELEEDRARQESFLLPLDANCLTKTRSADHLLCQQVERRKGAQRAAEEAKESQAEALREAARERFIRKQLEKDCHGLREELRQAALRQNHLTGQLRDRMAAVETDVVRRYEEARTPLALLANTIAHLRLLPRTAGFAATDDGDELVDTLVADLVRAQMRLAALLDSPRAPGLHSGAQRDGSREARAACSQTGAEEAPGRQGAHSEEGQRGPRDPPSEQSAGRARAALEAVDGNSLSARVQGKPPGPGGGRGPETPPGGTPGGGRAGVMCSWRAARTALGALQPPSVRGAGVADSFMTLGHGEDPPPENLPRRVGGGESSVAQENDLEQLDDEMRQLQGSLQRAALFLKPQTGGVHRAGAVLPLR